MVDRYNGSHHCQGDFSSVTRVYGCTWTSGAIGIDCATGGRKDPSPDYLHNLVKTSEQTDPGNPGWSLEDLDRAAARMGVGFEVRSGRGWTSLVTDHDRGLFIVLQGVSSVFSNETCSGAFNGAHAVGIHPDELGGKWRLHDPICRGYRYEYGSVLRRYAEALSRGIRYGVFTTPVPIVSTPTWRVTMTRSYTFWRYFVEDGRITDRVPNTTPNGFGADCTAPKTYPPSADLPDLPDKSLVRLTEGTRKGWYLESRFARRTD